MLVATRHSRESNAGPPPPEAVKRTPRDMRKLERQAAAGLGDLVDSSLQANWHCHRSATPRTRASCPIPTAALF
ncbi:MAG: hypothetical protein ABSF98_22685 [Bryobacteraceae bacterium]